MLFDGTPGHFTDHISLNFGRWWFERRWNFRVARYAGVGSMPPYGCVMMPAILSRLAFALSCFHVASEAVMKVAGPFAPFLPEFLMLGRLYDAWVPQRGKDSGMQGHSIYLYRAVVYGAN